MKGFIEEDASMTASVYAEDAVFLPPGGDMIHGKNAIEEFWGGVMASGVKEAKLTTVELSGGGDYLQEMGTGVLKSHPEGDEPAEQNAKYVLVWKRTPNGWRYKWDTWNSSPYTQSLARMIFAIGITNDESFRDESLLQLLT